MATSDRPRERIEAEPQYSYRVNITPRLVFNILGPYFYQKLKNQVTAILPISAFLLLFQLLVIRQPIQDGVTITAGFLLVIVGLMFFMEGLQLGLMPLGENIGAALPGRARLWLILSFAFLLGIGATLAEPGISILRTAGGGLQPGQAILLYEMLNRFSLLLVMSIAVGVGIATALGVYRFIAGWSLRRLLLPSLAVALVVTILAELNPATRDLVALAWDSGGVTTGRVTVPLVLALGVGVTTVLGKADTGTSGFGILTLASLWPVTVALLAAMAVYYTGSFDPAPAAVASAAANGAAAGDGPGEAILAAMLGSFQAIVPLAVLLYVVQRYVLREEMRNLSQIVLGLGFALVGLTLFGLGLNSGMVPLGQQVGGSVPATFAPPEALYGEVGGRIITILFAFAIGYGATLAEPAVNALGLTVEEITAGAFRKAPLMHTASLGVGLGLALGIAKIMFNLPMAYLIVPIYLALILLTLASEEKYINIGWDTGGVTTGEVTVPLVLAMGLGISAAVGAPEGFGLLALASTGPILTVLGLGLLVSAKTRAASKAETAAS